MDNRMNDCLTRLLDADQLETLAFALSEYHVTLQHGMTKACETLHAMEEDDAKAEWMLTCLGRDALESWRARNLSSLISEIRVRLDNETVGPEENGE